MRTVTIARYRQLNQEQWSRVIATVKGRVRKITGEECWIGLGRKFKGNQPLGWQLAVRVYLRKKRKRVAESKRVPAWFEIRLRRPDGKYDLLTIRSDVEGCSHFVPTGGRVRRSGENSITGLLIRWKRPGGDPIWGFVTVAHLFDRGRATGTTVRMQSTVFNCKRRRQVPRTSGSDVAVMEIRSVRDGSAIADALQHVGLIDSPDPAPIPVLTTAQVKKATRSNQQGETFGHSTKSTFRCEEVMPDDFPLGIRELDDCIRVVQSDANVFGPATSGSMWMIDGKVACMQAGGHEPSGFREGLGQSVHRFLPQIRRVLPSSSPFRVVAAF